MPQVHPVVYYQPVGVRETEGIVPGIHVGEPQIVVGIVEVRDVKYRASAGNGEVADPYLRTHNPHKVGAVFF